MSGRNYNNITDVGFEFVDGLENPSGLSEEAILVRVSDILTEGKPDPAGTTSSSIVTIITDHILKAAKAPINVQLLYGKSGAQFKLSGEELSKIFETDSEIFIPQISAEVLGGAVAIKNTRFLLMVRRPGQLTGYWQIGCKAMPCKVQDIAGGLGTGPTSEVGIKISVKAFDIVPMYDYQGEIPAPGV